MKFLLAIVVLAFSAAVMLAQTASNDPWPFPDRKPPGDDSHIVKDMLAKQQTAREKKEYADLIERGEEALRLSEELEAAIQKKDRLNDSDRKQLESFEKLVAKIREDLGGDDDGETTIVGVEKERPKDVREGFLFLKQWTEQLVSEIKKSTRFSVSIVAIETSNTLVRLARLLQLKN